MNIFIVYAHPDPKSFNAKLKDKAVEVLTGLGHSLQISDLYDMGFHPIASPDDFIDPIKDDEFDLQREQSQAAQIGRFAPDILAEHQKLFWCDLLILQFPMWWYSVPAIMKGWIDRILAYGVAYGEGHSLGGRRAMLVLTTGGAPRIYTPQMRDTISNLLEHLQRGTLHICGFDVLPPYAVYGAANTNSAQREQTLLQYTQLLKSLESIPPISFG
jgi:NAD(P)H dehydrogenase (quinone)